MASIKREEENGDAVIISEHLYEISKHYFKIRSKKKKYFKLCNKSHGGKARLESYSTEIRSLSFPPDSIILLSNVAKVQQSTDTENSILIVENGKNTTLQAASKERQQIWLQALQALLLQFWDDTDPPCEETINDVYFSYASDDKIKNKSYPAQIRSGKLFNKLETSKVFLELNGGILTVFDHQGRTKVEWGFRTIRSFALVQNNILKIETGRRAEGGEDIVHFEMKINDKKEFYKLMVKEKNNMLVMECIDKSQSRSCSSHSLSLPPPILEASIKTKRSSSTSCTTPSYLSFFDKRSSQVDSIKISNSIEEEELYWNSDDEYSKPDLKDIKNKSQTKPFTFTLPRKPHRKAPPSPQNNSKSTQGQNKSVQAEVKPAVPANVDEEEIYEDISEEVKKTSNLKPKSFLEKNKCGSANEDTEIRTFSKAALKTSHNAHKLSLDKHDQRVDKTNTLDDKETIDIIYSSIKQELTIKAKNDGRLVLLKPLSHHENQQLNKRETHYSNAEDDRNYAMPIKKKQLDQKPEDKKT